MPGGFESEAVGGFELEWVALLRWNTQLTCGFLFGIVAYLGVCFVVDPSMSGWLVPRFYADVPFRRHRTDPSKYLP